MTRFFILFMVLPTFVLGQKKAANVGTARFYSQKLNIEGENASTSGTIDLFTGEVAIDIPVEAFNFKSKWVYKRFVGKRGLDAKRHPFITFSGVMQGLKGRELKKLDKIENQLVGTLSIRGTTNDLKAKALLEVRDDAATLSLEHVIDRFAYGLKRRKWFVSQDIDCSLRLTFR